MTELEFNDFKKILTDLWPNFEFTNKRQHDLWRYAVDGLSVHVAEEYLMQLRMSKKGTFKPDVADFRALLPEERSDKEQQPPKPLEEIYDSFAWMYKGNSCMYPKMIPGYYVLVRVKRGQNVRESAENYKTKYLKCANQTTCSCGGGIWEVFFNPDINELSKLRNELHLQAITREE